MQTHSLLNTLIVAVCSLLAIFLFVGFLYVGQLAHKVQFYFSKMLGKIILFYFRNFVFSLKSKTSIVNLIILNILKIYLMN